VARAKLQLVAEGKEVQLEEGSTREDVGVVEAVVTADSPLVNSSASQLRLRERFQVDIPLTTLFERAVLSEQAESIVSAQLALFHRDDIERLEEELDGLSEEELRAILAETTTNE